MDHQFDHVVVVPATGSLYIYDVPKSYDEARNVVGRQMVCPPRNIRASSLQALEAEEMKWAEANQKVIMNPAFAPRFFQLKKGTTTVWTGKGEISLLVPLFKGTMNVLVGDSDAEYRIQWDCGFVLHPDEDTGIRPLTGDRIVHYN
ncbi:hypothetical protein QBC46DRAFT_414495 [Diplogelasinospora grovesii]|uniref:Uncharacterized protein n=1 Tax=Diplogelasinospora grovesii TaxID=303347 RepID=A0AAN6MUP3_9PEZI|nr:hypothetical protein QBC46DRAFT_414495 [Diplogelasinospora grovesii]